MCTRTKGAHLACLMMVSDSAAGHPTTRIEGVRWSSYYTHRGCVLVILLHASRVCAGHHTTRIEGVCWSSYYTHRGCATVLLVIILHASRGCATVRGRQLISYTHGKQGLSIYTESKGCLPVNMTCACHCNHRHARVAKSPETHVRTLKGLAKAVQDKRDSGDAAM